MVRRITDEIMEMKGQSDSRKKAAWKIIIFKLFVLTFCIVLFWKEVVKVDHLCGQWEQSMSLINSTDIIDRIPKTGFFLVAFQIHGWWMFKA